MSDFKLRGPGGDVVVTGDGGERSRLVAAGYKEETNRPAARAVDAESKPAVPAVKTEAKTPPKA